MEKEVRDQPVGRPTLVGSKFTVDDIILKSEHMICGVLAMKLKRVHMHGWQQILQLHIMVSDCDIKPLQWIIAKSRPSSEGNPLSRFQ